MKIYNKLVRDKIPEIMINDGAKPIFKILTDEDYLIELNKKLQEELNEYLESENIEELADLEEILLAILKYKKISEEEFNKIRLSKNEKRGSL